MAESDPGVELVTRARALLAASFHGVLSTQSLEYPGFPFGSVLPFSLDRDGWPLLLLSHLAKHTRNLQASPQCSLTLLGPGEGDIQKRLRLTCLARVVAVGKLEPEQAERHFRYYPDAGHYHRHLNFQFYRLVPERFYCVGGFGAARWIEVERMAAANPFSLQRERTVLEEINRRHGDTLARRVPPAPGGAPALAVGLDPMGLDLRRKDRLHRLSFTPPITNPSQATARL